MEQPQVPIGTPPVATPPDESASWFVLTTLDPQRTEEQLAQENARRGTEKPSRSPMEYFIPYQFLKRRVSQGHDRDVTDLPHSRNSVQANNETRSILKRYIFLRAREKELEQFLKGEWNRWSSSRLQFYLDVHRQRVTVPDRMMASFIEACSDMQLQFELGSSLDGLAVGEEVLLRSTPFRGERAQVLAVEHTPNGLVLTLGLNIIANAMVLRLPHVSANDVTRLQGGKYTIDGSHLIDTIQRQLMTILSRRVHGKSTDESRMKDSEVLDRLYTYRRHHFSTDASRRHFLALMLICAHLRRDRLGEAELSAQTKDELAAIATRPAAKAATDVRTYLQAALYLSTGDPTYRDAAKTYVREHEPKSNSLRQLVKLIRVKRI